MGLFDRIFGKKSDQPQQSATDQHAAPPATSEPAEQKPLSLQILYDQLPAFDPIALTERLRAYDPCMSDGTVESSPEGESQGTPFGRIAWGQHIVDFVAFTAPMPPAVVEQVVHPAHYPEAVKQKARAHTAHVLLYYAGDADPYEGYIALAGAAGVLSDGAIVVANEAACTSLPAEVFALSDSGDRLEILRSLPLPLIFIGMVKYIPSQGSRIWMRTHGANLLGLPDLAYWASGHQEGNSTMELYDSTLGYLLKSKAQVAPGHTLQVGNERFIKFRAPVASDPPGAPGERLLVVENIRRNQLNR